MVHDAQRGVAVLDLVHNDAKRAHIVNILKVDVLAAHLVPDAVDVLGPAIDLGLDSGCRQFLLKAPHGGLNESLALRALFVEHARNALVGLGFKIAEGEILQLPLHLPDAQAVGQWRVDQLAFTRHFIAQRARPVAQEAQRLDTASQAQHDHADVIYHGQQHLAQNLGLRLHLGSTFAAAGPRRRTGQRTQAAQALEPVDEARHRVAKAGFQDVGRILDMIPCRKQQGRAANIDIKVERGSDQCHAHSVLEHRFRRAQNPVTIGVTGELKRRLDMRLCLWQQAGLQQGE